MHPITFQLNPTYRLGADVVSRLWWPSWKLEPKNLAILNLHITSMPPTSLGSVRLTIQMWFEDFQDGHRGGHLGHWNGTILGILNLYVPLMPRIKFQLNPTDCLEGYVV